MPVVPETRHNAQSGADAATVAATAWRAWRAGLSVVPPAEDGTKRPAGSWADWQKTRPDKATMRRWYDAGRRAGVGVVCGAVSGNLELFEFDDHDTYRAFCETAAGIEGLRELVERIAGGYEETSPGGGIHWLYRCETISGNTKLAEQPGPSDEAGNPTRETLIETRGEGGYAVLAPSHGPVHPSGGAYQLRRGSLETIPTITPAERRALLNLARAFDAMPAPEPEPEPAPHRSAPSGSADDERPGDDFERRATWPEILEPHGWRAVGSRGGMMLWRRPGKPSNEPGHSAATNYDGTDRLAVYSTSTPFEALGGADNRRCSYSKFRAYAVLEHGGDHSAAARELRRRGYGRQDPTISGIPHAQDGAGAPPPRSGDTSQYRNTDTGNARRLVAQHGADLRYCKVYGKWFEWDGARWAVDDTDEVIRRAKATVQTIYAEAAEAGDADTRKALATHATRSEAARALQAMVWAAQSELPIRPDELDRDPWLLNVQNGTIDLRTGQLRPHRREDLITKLAPVVFDPDAVCPTFDRFLERIMAGNEALIRFVQRGLGYSLTGSTREQVAFFNWGAGANGKSTLMETFGAVLGDYAMQTAADTLMVKRGEGVPNDIARLKGARLVTAVETDQGRRISESLVKQLTGGDMVSARFMRGEWFDFHPTFKIWLATNHKPVIKGTDHAIWRRIRLIPYTITIPEDEQDKQLSARLRQELPGILAWAVRGCVDWFKYGLEVPDAVRDATAGYRGEMDVLAGFLDECCVIDAGAMVSSRDLYSEYLTWCAEAGERHMSQRAVGLSLTERGFTRKRYGPTKAYHWFGIGLGHHRAEGHHRTPGFRDNEHAASHEALSRNTVSYGVHGVPDRSSEPEEDTEEGVI